MVYDDLPERAQQLIRDLLEVEQHVWRATDHGDEMARARLVARRRRIAKNASAYCSAQKIPIRDFERIFTKELTALGRR